MPRAAVYVSTVSQSVSFQDLGMLTISHPSTDVEFIEYSGFSFEELESSDSFQSAIESGLIDVRWERFLPDDAGSIQRYNPIAYDRDTEGLVVWGSEDGFVPAPLTLGGGSNVPVNLFGYVRTASPSTLFSSKHRYDLSDLQWQTKALNGAGMTHIGNQSAARLETNTAANARMIYQTRRFIPYQPGAVQAIEMTFVIENPEAGRDFICGQFYEQNGYILKFVDANLDMSLGIRDSVQGTVRDTWVSRSFWNIDKFDGTGPSGLTFSLTESGDGFFNPLNSQIFVINYQWLAAGTVEFGFSIDGQYWPVHRFNHANRIARVYTSTATLPIRFEVGNPNNTTSTNGRFLQICCAIHSEGGATILDAEGLPFSDSNRDFGPNSGLTLNTDAVRVVSALRLKSTLNGFRNSKVVTALSPWLNSSSRQVWMGIVYAPSNALPTETGGNWSDPDSRSGVEYNTGLTLGAFPAACLRVYGNSIDSGSGSSQNIEKLMASLQLSLNIDGDTSDRIYLVAQRQESQNTVVWGGWNWKEIE